MILWNNTKSGSFHIKNIIMIIKNISILLLAFCMTIHSKAQQIPGAKQTKSVLILNATAHLGNGKIIENSAIGFK